MLIMRVGFHITSKLQGSHWRTRMTKSYREDIGTDSGVRDRVAVGAWDPEIES